MEEVTSGYFIKFTPEEREQENDLVQFLSDNNYPPGPEGIKELLLATIYIEEKPANPILNAIQENPEAVQNVMAGLGKIGGKLLNAKIFKK